MADYQFTINHPPLLKDFGLAILTIPEKNRSEVVGTTTWQDNGSYRKEVPATPGHAVEVWPKYFFTRELIRSRVWKLTRNPRKYGVETKDTIEVLHGYKTAEKRTIEKTLGLQASAGSDFLKLSVKATQELKITNETTTEWRVEEKDTKQVTHKEDYTYASWILCDRLVARTSGYVEVWTSYTHFDKQLVDQASTLDIIMVDQWEDSALFKDDEFTSAAQKIENLSPHMRSERLMAETEKILDEIRST